MPWRGNKGRHSIAAAKGWRRVKSTGVMHAHSKRLVTVKQRRDVRSPIRVVRGKRGH